AGILFGRRQKKEASQIFTLTFILTAICSLIFLVAAFFVADPLAHLLSGGGVLEEEVADFVFVCLAGQPALGLGLLMSSFLASDSHPQLASIYFIISNGVNLLLDYVFLKFTPLGVSGAALSTMIGFAAGFVVIIPYLRSKKRMLSFCLPQVTVKMLRNILTTGMTHVTYLVSVMIKTLLMNSIVLSFLGETGMAVYTVCTNTALILMMFISGVIGVIPNIAGMLYGEKDYYGIQVLCKKVFRYGAILTAVLMLSLMLFTGQFTLLFGIDSGELQRSMILVLRIYVFSMPFMLWNYFGMQYYGSVEKSGLATFITTLENGVFLVPITLASVALGQGQGYVGLAVAFVLSEGLTLAASVIYRKIKYRGEPLLLISNKNPGVCLDFTIAAEISEVAAVPKEIGDFC
ncbi:MAG: MATE family efflux transporter, partial [Anaerovoracaceae bacterium]